MEDLLPLTSDCSLQEARMRAVQYRMMADTATTRTLQTVLLQLARRYDQLAGREQGGAEAG